MPIWLNEFGMGELDIVMFTSWIWMSIQTNFHPEVQLVHNKSITVFNLIISLAAMCKYIIQLCIVISIEKF